MIDTYTPPCLVTILLSKRIPQSLSTWHSVFCKMTSHVSPQGEVESISAPVGKFPTDQYKTRGIFWLLWSQKKTVLWRSSLLSPDVFWLVCLWIIQSSYLFTLYLAVRGFREEFYQYCCMNEWMNEWLREKMDGVELLNPFHYFLLTSISHDIPSVTQTKQTNQKSGNFARNINFKEQYAQDLQRN